MAPLVDWWTGGSIVDRANGWYCVVDRKSESYEGGVLGVKVMYGRTALFLLSFASADSSV